MPNTILKRWNGTLFEELYPKTTTSQISATGTPSSTTALFGDSSWKTTPTGSGSSTTIAYWSGTNSIGFLSTGTYPSLAELSYVKGTTSSIQTQLNNKPDAIEKYKASATNNATTTPAAITTITLLANKYYHIDVVGQWSKASTSGSTSPRITVAVDNTTGTPTMNGQFFWLNSGTTAYTVGILSGAITTTTTTMGFTTATAQLSAVTAHPWNMKSLFYSGTSDKVLTFYVYQSVAVSGNVTCDNISIIAIEVAP